MIDLPAEMMNSFASVTSLAFDKVPRLNLKSTAAKHG